MNLYLSLLSLDDAEQLFAFEKENKEFFESFVPPRPDSYFRYEDFCETLEELLEEQDDRRSLFYLIKGENGQIIGRMNLIDIDWVTKSGSIGYRVGQKFSGKGAAVKGLQLLILETQNMGLKELRAKTTRNNLPSQKVLDRCLFQKESEEKGDFIYYKLAL
ncbi:GNAT family protein [Bacillus sp. ISL-37]|jgi:[ribosomal protein S5]-alanine N-acetyltransferase|uniref:GNAT family N-acetyltransferase n=1 Tax=Bacillus sp. ISL-37 TaxID=2819123 RepID=UPI001BE7ACD2|nr:GNAT family protein [Bacillus sp. ISL-37]MBT2683408.1 GNAT family N-acetyltransferase [Bacillus sp. ISL-37]